MKKKLKYGFILLILLSFVIFEVKAQVDPVYVSVNNENQSESLIVYLESNNYSIYVNISGELDIFDSSRAGFNMIKDDTTYYSVVVDWSDSFPYTVTNRLTITDSGNYNFSFFIEIDDTSDYLNYEVILTEMEIIYHPKTSIISEAPYGLVFMLLAVFVIGFMKKRRRLH